MPDSTLALRNAENNAISNSEPSYGNSGGNSGFYTGSGRSQSKKKAGWMKKRTAAVVITLTLLLGGGAAFLGSSNSLLAPALEALTTSSTQTSFTSYTERSKYLVKGMMIDDVADDIVVSHPWTSKYLKVPNYMKTRFSDFGIDVSGSGKDTRMIWKDQTMDADGFIKMYNENVEFRNDFTKAKRGRVATFFDDVAEKIYTKLGISRNLFSKYKQTGDADADVTNYRDTMSSKFDSDSTDLNTRTQYEVEETSQDENGNTVTNTKTEEVSSNGSATSNQTIEAGTMLKGLAEKVGQVGSWTCTALKVGSMIGAVVAAQETYQSINYFMGLMENISKMKAGYGDASAVNEVLNFFSTSQKTTTTSDFGKLGVVTIAEGTEPEIEQKTENGSPLEASGIQVMLANAPATPNSAENYSLERVIKSLGGAAAFGATAMGVCSGIDMANSLLSIGTAIATSGASIVANFLFKAGLGIVTTISVSAFLSFLIPTLANTFISNAFETATGIPAGQLFAKGGAAANMREGRSGSGQSPSTKQQIAEFNHSTQQVLALDAELDRYNLSPFDSTNRNTFFGSIAYSLFPTIRYSNITSLSSLIRSATNSLSSLLRGNVYADGDGTSYLTTYGDCPLLETIYDAAGDLYCNPIVTTDMSTIDINPNNDTYVNVISQDLDCNNSTTSINTSSTSGIDGSNVTIIGDSITYGANLNKKFDSLLPNADIHAEGSKHFISNSRPGSGGDGGLKIVQDLINSNSLRDNVVFALGTNDQLEKEDIEQVIKAIGNREIYFITNYGTSYGNLIDYNKNNQYLKDAAKDRSNIHIITWAEHVSTSGNATSYVPSGDVHPTSAGQDLFVKLIHDAIVEHNSTTASSGDGQSSIGNCRIKEKTNLARYITYCDGRDSPFGVVDQNILGAEELGNSVLNSIPGVNDVMGLINGVIDLENIEWANGAKCVNSSENDFWQNYGKYYQRYVEDQRILEQMGAYEGSKNPVTAYTEEYEKQYEATRPEANTYIGYLSRISGLTVENTETVLAFITYYNFVDQYDPTLRIAMDGDTTEPQSGEQVVASIQDKILRFDDSNIDTPLYADTSKYIAYVDYSDLRNRSYAA